MAGKVEWKGTEGRGWTTGTPKCSIRQGFLRDVGVLPHTLPVLRDTLVSDMIWGSQSPEIWDSVDLGVMDFCFKELCCIHVKRRCFNTERV